MSPRRHEGQDARSVHEALGTGSRPSAQSSVPGLNTHGGPAPSAIPPGTRLPLTAESGHQLRHWSGSEKSRSTPTSVKRSEVYAQHWVIERAAHLVEGAPKAVVRAGRGCWSTVAMTGTDRRIVRSSYRPIASVCSSFPRRDPYEGQESASVGILRTVDRCGLPPPMRRSGTQPDGRTQPKAREARSPFVGHGRDSLATTSTHKSTPPCPTPSTP